MTPLLLDTHAYLWFVFDDHRMSAAATSAIADADTDPIISVASLWEITIKQQLGKLRLGMDLGAFFRRHVEERRMMLLPVEIPHLVAYGQLPLLHRDPFDRILIAQARALGARIATADATFARYGIETVW